MAPRPAAAPRSASAPAAAGRTSAAAQRVLSASHAAWATQRLIYTHIIWPIILYILDINYTVYIYYYITLQ